VFKQIYLILRTLVSVVAMVVSVIWRQKWLRYGFLLLLVGGAVLLYFLWGNLPGPVTIYDAMKLPQGWTEDQRERYYQTSQGTLIMPYDWFLALEQPPTLKLLDNLKLFRDNANVTRYRLIPDLQPKYNPHLLPIGLAKATLADDLVADLGLGHKEWLSFTCAACHTAQMSYKGLGIRIEGAPGNWDFSNFSGTMTATLAITYAAPTKFDRFAKKVLALEGKPDTEAERQRLRQQIDQYRAWPLITDAIRTTVSQTYPTREGSGRTDALGRGANGQFSPLSWSNVRVGNAPVSFPPLWYTHDYDWVQSITGIRQPLGRNVTESWGVNAIVDLTNADPAKLFRSTHPMFNLFWMETLISVLEAPPWPEQVFGAVDRELAEKGRVLYEQAVWKNPRAPQDEIYCDGSTAAPCPNPERVQRQQGYCARCHSPVREPGYDPACDAAKSGKECPPPIWQLTLYKLDVMGTSSNDAKNFNARATTLDPGTGTYAAAYKASPYGSQPFGIGTGLAFTTSKVMDWWFAANQGQMQEWVKAGVFPDVASGRRIMEGFRANRFRAPLAYPARPMAGYWATPPFLHNHSVPDMYQLLSPVGERSKTFYTGNVEFDPENLGYQHGAYPHGMRFDTGDAGNSNAGHEFSHRPGDPARPGVIGPYLEPEQRRAILEYMKIIRDVPPPSAAEMARRRELLAKMKPFYEGDYDKRYDAAPARGYADAVPAPR
jgi:hypothetical protein